MKFWKLASVTTALVLSTSVNAALIERLGGLAYYDDIADLTWLADANSAGTTMNWIDANNWAAGLSVDGVYGWRLANTLQPDATCDVQGEAWSSSFNCTGSEMGNMFYNVLGGVAGVNILSEVHSANLDLFTNIQANYWTATEFAPEPDSAWAFGIASGGSQGYGNKVTSYSAWAVHDGDIGASVVPVPAAVWLFGSGLIGLAGLAKRKKA